MDSQELIATLKAQHRILNADLIQSLKSFDLREDGYPEAIFQNLLKFRQDLLVHLKLEDEVFYPDYFKKSIGDNKVTAKGEEFLKTMDGIGKIVQTFLKQYDTVAAIEDGTTSFRDDLVGTMSTLKTRIETEEEGLYDLYLLMK